MHRIAIIEDNPDNMELFIALLEDEYDLDGYPDGPAALAGIAARRPDLALMDISLPGMDGVQVLERCRELYPDLVAIALTAHAMTGDRERLLKAGFDGYISKPVVDEDEFFDAIEALLP